MTRPAPARPPRPPLFPYPSELPAITELAGTPHWVAWRYAWRQERQKWAKPPVNAATGRLASSTNAASWTTLERARAAYEADPEIGGVGFALTHDYAMVDLDDCFDPETGSIVRAEAREVVAALNSYCEITPGGRGLHVVVRGRVPDTLGKRNDRLGVEAYSTDQYLTITGRHLPGSPTTIEDRQAELEAVVKKFIGERKARAVAPAQPQGGATQDDEVILERCRSAKNGAKFLRLWAGDASDFPKANGEPDHHLADLSLCSLLAFWTDDRAQIDRMFRRSGLFREKWNRNAYREDTIEKALNRVDRYRGRDDRGEADYAELWAALAAPVDAAPVSGLAEVIATFQRWLYLPDPSPLVGLLGAIAANHLSDPEPVWLLLVGAPSSGKTAALNPFVALPHVHSVSTLTPAALLSGTPKRDVQSGSHGGVLRKLGTFGILIVKDFTSVLNQHRETQGEALSALREIYDGHWTRDIGSDGGRSLEWSGKLGLIGGVTEAIDRAHSVRQSMGERFVYLRMPKQDADAKLDFVLQHPEMSGEAHAEMAAAVVGLFLAVEQLEAPIDGLSLGEHRWLKHLARLSAAGRSAVERDGTGREIIHVPTAEDPTRLAKVLLRLYTGMRRVGVAQPQGWEVIRRVALDSLPTLRRRVLETLALHGRPLTSSQVAQRVKHPTETTRRTLQDLEAHDLLDRSLRSGDEGGDEWTLTEWATEMYGTYQSIATEMRVDDGLWGENPYTPPLTHSTNISGEVGKAGVPPPVDVRPTATDRPPCDHCGERATHHYRDPEAWLCLGCAVRAGFVAEDAPPVDEAGGEEADR